MYAFDQYNASHREGGRERLYVAQHPSRYKLVGEIHRHMPGSSDVQVFKCHFLGCDYQTVYPHNLKRHVQKHCKTERQYHYQPETRQQIAEYAIEHGVGKAARMFTMELGHPVRWTTVQGMKSSYLKRQQSLMSSQHGTAAFNNPLVKDGLRHPNSSQLK